MATTSNGRRDAIYDAIAMSANFGQLSNAEKDALKAQIGLIWGDGDLGYIVSNMDVLPAAHSGLPLNSPSGQAVQVSIATGTGTTTALQNISGKGSVA